MPSRPLPDLTPREFRDAVAELGFAYLGGSVDKFVDRKFRKAGQYIDMVRGELPVAELRTRQPWQSSLG